MVDQYDGSDPEYAQLLRECHGIIGEEIENLRRLVREFSDFGRMPEPAFSQKRPQLLISDVVKLYHITAFCWICRRKFRRCNSTKNRIRRC